MLGTASASCEIHRKEVKEETAMLATAATLTLNPLFLRHDLMIEMSRIEMAIDYARGHEAANDQRALAPLENKLARINEALSRLSA
jgi:hypothetical protein